MSVIRVEESSAQRRIHHISVAGKERQQVP
jgi:hypothetical protein